MKNIVRCLQDKKRFLVLSHVCPDGDAIGSTLALALALRSAGKEADVIGADPTPHSFRSLPGAGTIRLGQEAPSNYDAAVILECSDPSRTGVKGLEDQFLINIDHHASAKPYGNLNWIDTSFGAVGQLIFRLIEAMNIPVTREIATNIYVALMTDTGSFQFANTTAVEFGDAGRLVRLGARPAEIYEQVFHSNTYQRMRLLGRVLSTMETTESHRIAWVYMLRDMLQHTGALPEDTEGIINHLLTIKTVQVAAFFKQESENCFKLSLRSKGDLDVSSIAQQYHGGGHKNAAGFTVHADFEAAKRQVLGQLQQLINHGAP